MLSRAVKDHERRGAWKEGFTNHPGDCLAYKYYRDVRPPSFHSLLASAVHLTSLSAWSRWRASSRELAHV